MRLLLDTHVLLWWLDDSRELSKETRDTIAAPEHMVFVSAVTIWEIVIKKALRKLELPDDWAETVADEPFRRLPVTWEHALAVERLPHLHRDPFDRMLIAQAKVEDLVVVTHEEVVQKYNVPHLQASRRKSTLRTQTIPSSVSME